MTGADEPPESTQGRTETIDTIHEHLDATAELPVDPRASTYLGEAAAVAADARAAMRDGHHEAARTRVEQVRDLLSHVDDTRNDAADDHVAEAARLTEAFLADENDENEDDENEDDENVND